MAPGRAGRRGRDAAPELHADLGRWPGRSAATVREWPLRSSTDGGPLARRSRRAGQRWSPDRTKLIVICNPNNPTGARLPACRSRRHLRARPTASAPGCCRTRSTAAPSSTAWRRRRCGAGASGSSSPAACRRPTACRACASAGSSRRRRLVAIDLVVPRLHHHRARGAERPAGAHRRSRRRGAQQLLERTRGDPAREPAGARATGCARTASRSAAPCPRPAPSSTCATTHAINSTELVNRLRDEKSVLIVPGDHFGMDGYLRIGFGERPALPARRASARLHDLLASLGRPGRVALGMTVARSGTSSSSASATSAGGSCGCSPRSRATALDFDWRVVGIATRRHGSVVDADGIDVAQALALVEADQSLDRLGRRSRASRSGLDVIRQARRLLADEAAGRPPRRASRSTVLDIERGEPATRTCAPALEARVHVVTVNKGPVAFAYRELDVAAPRPVRPRVPLRGRGDGRHPGLQPRARDDAGGRASTGFRGVINTTTNYILTAMERGEAFDEALARDAGAGHRRSRPVARRRRLGRRGQDRGAGQRADGAAPITPHQVRAHRHRARCTPDDVRERRAPAAGASGWWRAPRGRDGRSRPASSPRCWPRATRWPSLGGHGRTRSYLTPTCSARSASCSARAASHRPRTRCSPTCRASASRLRDWAAPMTWTA